MSEHEPSTTSESFNVLLRLFYTDHVPARMLCLAEDLPVEPNLEEYVKSERFDQECAVQLRKALGRASVSDNRGDSDYENSISNDGTSPHEVPRAEGYLYYAGLGPNGRGPKLIYRTSDDKFVEPEGPRAYTRLMKLCPVPEDHELGQDGRWDRIRDQVRGRFGVQHSVN